MLFLLLLAAAAPSSAAGGSVVEERAALRLSARSERHIRERHFPGGRQTRGKSIFYKDADLAILLELAGGVEPRRQANGRDKRVAATERPIGTDGRSGRALKTFVVIAEPDGEVVTMYPGR